jgi:(p)ppGpp synthase/HD superfamily hydrolase
MTEEPSQISPRLYEALQLAFSLHGHDARKSSKIPVLAHLLSVCSLVQLDGGDEDEAIAGLLHDALEDKPQEVTPEDIEKRFGEKVHIIVEVSTDTPKDFKGGPKPPWRERKEAFLKHIRQSKPDLLRVTAADKVDNARAMLADHHILGSALWKKFNAPRVDQIWYYQEAVKAYQEAGFKSHLLNELQELVDRLSKLT